jgi:hypothetical protein
MRYAHAAACATFFFFKERTLLGAQVAHAAPHALRTLQHTLLFFFFKGRRTDITRRYLEYAPAYVTHTLPFFLFFW